MISVSGASEATGEAAASTASWAPGDGEGGVRPFLPVRRPRRNAASNPEEAYFSPGKAIATASLGRYQVGTLRSISRPVRPEAISRSAVTVGLSLLSRRGAWPWTSSRAR
ncbi:Uncharacterised protein [Bordetella pertussis]|nr:Uncharacterised protein [Bordetella pertussis]